MPKARIEKEAKMLLSKEEFDVLCSLRDFTVTTQINHYYQGNEHCALRIREFPDSGKRVFTLKERVPGGHREYEKEIPEDDFSDPYVQEVLQQFALREPLYLGDLLTVRHLYQGESGEICLDENHYLGITDYEFEFELYDADTASYAEGLAFLQEAGLNYRENPLSKLKRFLDAKKEKS
ncbi:MAG: CYTH domain-containing protein [Erysipelotrichaceae bacterium]|nr:CYTH domain-containing protein [Erysipelotrichaceae bacterium]